MGLKCTARRPCRLIRVIGIDEGYDGSGVGSIIERVP